MNKLIIIMCSLFIVRGAFAAIPTIEGLFRNSSNREISGELLIVSYSIEEQQNEELLQKAQSETNEGELEGEMLKEKAGPLYVKEMIVLSEDKTAGKSIKYIYDSSEMKNADRVQVRFIPDYSAKILNEYDINKRVFYSISAMYLLNNSKIIGALLGDKGNGYSRNKEILDVDKVKLMERYKDYLIATKEDPDLREELSSPLNPTDLEERRRVLDLMKKNMYQRNSRVSLIKEKNEYRWKVDLGTIQATFSNEGHRLKQFTYQDNGMVEVTAGDYILFDGVHELPKVLFIKSNNDRVYKVRFLKLKYYQNGKKKFAKSLKNLNKVKKEILKSDKVYNGHPLVI